MSLAQKDRISNVIPVENGSFKKFLEIRDRFIVRQISLELVPNQRVKIPQSVALIENQIIGFFDNRPPNLEDFKYLGK